MHGDDAGTKGRYKY